MQLNYHTKYWQDNREYLSKYRREWYRENKEKVLTRCKNYAEKNREKIKEYQQRYHIENREKINITRMEYYYKNRDLLKSIMKKYLSSRKGKIYIRRKNYQHRHLQYRFFKSLLDRVIEENILKYGISTCENCRTQMVWGFEIDHIFALSKGGLTEYDNLQILCRTCNTRKQTKTIDYRVKAYLEAH